MPQYIYLYQEHVYIDDLPHGIEGQRAFKTQADALRFFDQQRQNYARQFPNLDISNQTQTVYDHPQDQVDADDQDDLVINTGFSEIKDGQRKLRISIMIRKLPLEPID